MMRFNAHPILYNCDSKRDPAADYHIMQVDHNSIHIRAQEQVDYNNKVHEYQLKWQNWLYTTE